MEFKQKVTFKDTIVSFAKDQSHPNNRSAGWQSEIQKNKPKTQQEYAKGHHNAQKLVQSELKQKGLTQQQRKLVGDIGKLFSGEASKPAKLLIRLNETKANKNGSRASVQNRLQKIEVTRLEEDSPSSQLKLEQLNFNSLSPPPQEADHPDSDIDIWHEDQSLDYRAHLQITRQVAIMFTPDLNISSVLNMKNPPTLFTRFGKKAEKSEKRVESAFSYELLDQKTSKENDLAPEATNFVKLMEIELFLKRKEVRQQRSEELRHSNQKLLAAHLSSKQQMQRTHQMLKVSQKIFKEQLEELQVLIEQEKLQNKQLKAQLQTKQQSFQSVTRLKQQYAIQNNNLKQKIKEYIKIIHQLKVEATRAMDTQRSQQPEVRQQVPTKATKGYRIYTNNDQIVQPAKPTKREVTFHAISHEPPVEYYYHPNYAYEGDERDCSRSYEGKMREDMKLANCRSQLVFTRGEIEKTALFAPEPTSRSQKATGIKKNTVGQEPISPSTRNLVRVSKGAGNDASVLMGEKLQGNKSISSISNLSGKSLSQRVGFVAKPPAAERKQGMLVDYMIEPYSELEAGQQQEQQEIRREKFAIRKQ